MADLDNKIALNDVLYNITAVTAETADKTKGALTLKKYSAAAGASSTVYSHNGSNSKNVFIVPADGGSFIGPVALRTANNLSNSKENKKLILNREDIESLLTEVKGLPAFAWDGSNLVTLPTNDETVPNICVITGTSANLVTLRSSSEAPKNYLYFCTDYYGDIYLKLETDVEPRKLGNRTIEALKLCDQYNANNNLTVDDINARFNSVTTSCNDAISSLGTDLTDTFNTRFQKLETPLFTQKGEGKDKSEGLITRFTNIEKGSVAVPMAELATKAQVATKDSANNVISDYYQKRISVIHADEDLPTGSDGDILIIIP